MNQILNVETVEQAQTLLEELGLVIEHDETHERYVEGRALLEAMGLSYEGDSFRKSINRVIESNTFIEGNDYVVVHPSQIHRDTACPDRKYGNRAKAYVFTPKAGACAVLSAHTDKGKVARNNFIEKTITQQVALETVAESTSHEEAVNAACLGLTGEVHELMNMRKPSQRIQRLLDKGEPIDSVVSTLIKASANNPKASYDDRVRFANSLRHAVEQVSAEMLTSMIKGKSTLISNHLVQKEAADNAILKYERRLARQQHSLLESKLQK